MGLNGHPFVYQECAGRANPAAHWNLGRSGELPESSGWRAVISGLVVREGLESGLAQPAQGLAFHRPIFITPLYYASLLRLFITPLYYASLLRFFITLLY
jgi:hypothetical protein